MFLLLVLQRGTYWQKTKNLAYENRCSNHDKSICFCVVGCRESTEHVQIAAGCSYTPNGDLASLSSVYTFPAHRRKHYAENMVYQVTRIVKDTGAMPMLYTDADYAASNACYEKIGYVLKGKLCTIGGR